MLFCPNCANLLVIGAHSGSNKWVCNSCPYEFPITKQHTARTRMRAKAKDDMLDANKREGVQTEVQCPKCEHNKAFWHQFQTRSADEPSTNLLFRCVKCGYNWNN
ncbi:transcription factor S-II-domain-containing protein [Auriculariales sp. MPI-PUGE-AT-0066]|nr:transcription factor S-II-domain-containing protein [Auriculariales sp. MPI-PUGE-AT-0066]